MRIGINIGIGRRSGGGGSFRSSHPLLLTRSTAAWAQDLSGNLFAFGVNERRLTNAGLTITGAATRLHGEAPTNGDNQSATSTPLSAEGLFKPMRVASTGAIWNRRNAPDFAITNGTPVYVRARVRSGTSGRVRLMVRNNTAATESLLLGTFAAPSVTISDAGAITAIVNRLLPNGDREFTFTWTPNSTAATGQIGIGPDSATTGQAIDIIGMQATSQFSEWIMGGASTFLQAADVATLDLALSGNTTRLHGEAPANGSNSGATSSVLSAEGVFNPLRSISAGAAFHRRASPDFALTNGIPVYVRARVRAGTSGRVRITCRNSVAVTESLITGVFAAPAVTATASGAITSFVNLLLTNGDREITFVWTPNATSATAQIAVGPDSAVSGETIDIIGMQATTEFSDWIMGSASAVTQSSRVSMAAGFMLRMDGTVLGTPRVNFDRFYQADNAVNGNRSAGFVSPGGTRDVGQFDASVSQGSAQISATVTPPSVFSIIGAHGENYIGGASGGVVATPDTTASYITPTRVFIGSQDGATNNLPLLLTRITLFPEVPTTPRVTAVSA